MLKEGLIFSFQQVDVTLTSPSVTFPTPQEEWTLPDVRAGITALWLLHAERGVSVGLGSSGHLSKG